MKNQTEINLNKTYSWFQETIGVQIQNSMNTFFENNFSISLVSIGNKDSIKEEPFLKGELFYTCQIPIENKQHIILRVSSDFVRIIFHDMFGSSSPLFNIEDLTELERQILDGFFEFIIKGIDGFILKEEEILQNTRLNKSVLNLSFFVKTEETSAGKLSLTLPSNRVKPKFTELKTNFDFEDFITNFAYVNLITGFAKISLQDLKGLSKDDILILDKSNADKMILKTQNISKEIKVNPEPSIILDIDNEEDDEEEDYNTEEYKENFMADNKNMWDDIQIEVTAEFQKVKMSLGDLKQISNGLVIDVGPVVKNEISLLVENKEVAKGELVIINDKYGVRVTEVFAPKKEDVKNIEQKEAPKAENNNEKPQTPPQQKAVPPVPPKRPIPPQTPVQKLQAQGAAAAKAARSGIPPKRPVAGGSKEDFDYSNFEE